MSSFMSFMFLSVPNCKTDTNSDIFEPPQCLSVRCAAQFLERLNVDFSSLGMRLY